MKTYYCLNSKFYNDGRCNGVIFPVEAAEQPQNTMKSKARYDEYFDYYEDEKIAKAELFLIR